MKLLLRIIGIILVLILAILLMVRCRYGGGAYYEDLSTPPLWGAAALEVVATLDQPPGNLAVSADNRFFFNYHPESHPVGGSTVFELNPLSLLSPSGLSLPQKQRRFLFCPYWSQP